MKRTSAVLALLIAIMVGTCALPAQAQRATRSRYDHMLTLRMKEKWLLPPVTLANAVSRYVFDFDRKLRLFTNGQIVKNIEKVDFSFQPTPYAIDTLRNKDQASALTQLGMLAAMGHFAVLNARDEKVRAGAVIIMNELADIADHFKLGNLSSQYQRLATDVADPKFDGGPSPITARYDATVNALFDWVASSYGVDGHWFFMYGNVIGGMYALTTGGDQFHTQYYLSVLNDLYFSKPRFYPDFFARFTMTEMIHEPVRDTQFLSNETWAILNHYITGSNYYANPRYPHYDLEDHRYYYPR